MDRPKTAVTSRLVLRPTLESDRERFVSLFGDAAFMKYSDGVMEPDDANFRFDHMLAFGRQLPFAKQPIIERASDRIIGYAGVNEFKFEGEPRLEFGWRLDRTARGKGYATEAAQTLLKVAARHNPGEILAMIDPRNDPSKRVAKKLGFEFWKGAVVGGYLDGIYRWNA